MNSSTSSSDPGAERGWARFALVLVGVAASAMALMLAFLFVLDPFDTGRPGWIEKPGVRPQGPRTAAASRGRDPAFNAAIFGNSHVQLLSPERLNAQTGLAFVSLIAPATHPREQLALLDWFLRHHRGGHDGPPAKAVIIGVDGNWCTADPALPNEKPFPFWLYERSLLAYAGGLIRFDLLEEAARRIDWLRKRNPPRARPDGYWDYEASNAAQGHEVRLEQRASLEKHEPAVPLNATGRFPAADRLARLCGCFRQMCAWSSSCRRSITQACRCPAHRSPPQMRPARAHFGKWQPPGRAALFSIGASMARLRATPRFGWTARITGAPWPKRSRQTSPAHCVQPRPEAGRCDFACDNWPAGQRRISREGAHGLIVARSCARYIALALHPARLSRKGCDRSVRLTE